MTLHEDDNETLLARVRSAGEQLTLGPDARARITRRLGGAAAGATTLREGPHRRSPHMTAWAAVAAAIVIGVIVWPLLDRSTTVSAAEVLGRSQQALSAGGHGIETVTYDLDLGGALQELLPVEQSGRFTVIETVDRDQPGRYKVVKLGLDGRVMAALAVDPKTGTRGWYFVVDGRGHLLRASNPEPALFSYIAVRTFALQTLIGMMQASNSAALQEIDRGGEPAYAVDVPVGTGSAGPIALARGRAVVARSDSRLLDFQAEGTIGGRPFTITFNLRNRTDATAASADTFTLTANPGDQVIDLPGSRPSDMLALLGKCLEQ